MGLGKLFAKLLLLCGLLAAPLSHGQSFSPPLTSWSITNVAGVTYFLHSHRLDICNWVEVGNVGRFGTNLTLHLSQKRGTYCPECFDCYHVENHSTPLGALEPGFYELALFFPDLFDPWANPTFPSLVISFEVTPSAGKMLTVSDNSGAVKVDVAGVPSAIYVVERSTTLTNWSPVATNATGSFAVTNSSPVAGAFYRARVLSGKTDRPE